MEQRVPPQNLDAERSVLGGLMLEAEAWDEVADILTEDDFYKPSHRKIFAAIKDLQRRGQPTDAITVSDYLMKSGDLEIIGGPSYLAEVIDLTPSAAHIHSHATLVRDKALLRRVISVSQSFIERS